MGNKNEQEGQDKETRERITEEMGKRLLAFDLYPTVTRTLRNSIDISNLWESHKDIHGPYLHRADDLLSNVKGLVMESDNQELPLITRERAEFSVPETDCGGREYTSIEREDNVRYILEGAEIQRDKDRHDAGFRKVTSGTG